MRANTDPALRYIGFPAAALVIAIGTASCGGTAEVIPTPAATASPSPNIPSPSPTETVSPLPSPTGTPFETKNLIVTFYGAVDNDPPGSRDIAHPVIHNQAGGTGNYEDPLTFAAPDTPGALPYGTRIYLPYIEKYAIREDDCGTSQAAPNGCTSQVDVYIGNPSVTQAAVDCENRLTPDGPTQVIVNPTSNLAVNSAPLWDEAARKCAA